MGNSLQNYVDQQGPVVSAAWLNGVDSFVNSLWNSVTTIPAARAQLCSDLPLEIANGGTAARTAALALSNLGGTTLAAALAAVAAAGYVSYPVIAAEVSAGVTVVNLNLPPYYIDRYGTNTTPGTTDMTAAINAALAVAGQGAAATQGASIYALPSIYLMSSTVILPNRVRVIGVNKRGTTFIAPASWNSATFPWMFHAISGVWTGGSYATNTSSMFDSTLENCTVNCSSVAGLGGILSDAWQDGCGTRGVLILNFTTSAVKFQNGYGGADTCLLSDTEIFGVGGIGCVGIDLSTALGLVAGFKVNLQNVVIAGGSINLAQGVLCVGNSVIGTAVHFETCTDGFRFDGPGFHSLTACDGSVTVTNLITLVSTFVGSLLTNNCRRNSASVLIQDNRAGGVGTMAGFDPPQIKEGAITPDVAPGANWSCGYFDGTVAGTNPPTAGFNVASIQRNSAGNYSVLESIQRPSSACAPWASCNLVNATFQVEIVNASKYIIIISVAGTPTDSSEVHFGNVRLQ